MKIPHARFFPIAIASLGILLLARSGCDAPPETVLLPVPAPVTVSVAMGDLGGKIFGVAPDAAKTRHYFVAAEPELWDFAPQGVDVVCGKPLPPPLSASRKAGKLRYVQYTDATFTAKVMQPPSLGILGPVLRGVVGEYLAVTFLNRTSRPLSMHPHGAKYDKDSEGAYYEPKPGLGAAVGPGATFTYIWQLDADSGPRADEPSSKGWLYHSHVSGDEEVNLGLVGFLIVTDPKRARPDGTPADVDRELATLFMIFDESGVGAALKEAAEYADPKTGKSALDKTWAEIQQLTEQGSRYAMNGRVFGNLAGLEMNEGERVRWYLFALGSEQDMHTAHWHGLRVIEEGRRRTDVVALLPASMKVVDAVADNPGAWLFHCHVAEHMMEGMFTRFTVHAKGAAGVSRAPESAFFGMPQARQSLHIERAEAVIDAADSCRITLEGTVTVFRAFSVFNQAVRVQLGEKSVTFQPDVSGRATGDGGSFRVKNANRFGVIPDGPMQFETTLTGAGWRAELQKLGAVSGSRLNADAMVTWKIQVGAAQHAATTRIGERRTSKPPAE